MNNYNDSMDKIMDKFSKGPVNRDGKPLEVVFEVRQGDGNSGEFHVCDIYARNAYEALVNAHRHGLIRSPWDVRITMDIDGDNASAHVASYVKPIWGDSCRWSASAHIANNSINQSLLGVEL